jgi:hypothetical protein
VALHVLAEGAVVVQLAGDRQRPGGEVDVCPAQAERLGDPEARVGERGRDRAEGMAELGQEQLDLGCVQVAGLADSLRARAVVAVEVSADVPFDHLALDRVAEETGDEGPRRGYARRPVGVGGPLSSIVCG